MKAAAVAVLVGLSVVPVAAARADAITEEQAQCNGKEAGDPCGTNGACVTQTCSRPSPDGTRSTWDCQVCREGAPRKPGASAGAAAGGSKAIYIGIAVAVAVIVCGLSFAYTRRRKPPSA